MNVYLAVIEVGDDALSINYEGCSVEIAVDSGDRTKPGLWNYSDFQYDMGYVESVALAIERAGALLITLSVGSPRCPECNRHHIGAECCAEAGAPF